jgi:16S rRNA (guanine527-N7)-methyltransferase
VDLGCRRIITGKITALALAGSPVSTVLIESDQRKAAFLSAVSRETGVRVTVLAQRIEDAPPQAADVVSARALAPLPALLPLVDRHLKPGGTALLLKGEGVSEELSRAREVWRFEHQLVPSLSHSSGTVLIVKELRRA